MKGFLFSGVVANLFVYTQFLYPVLTGNHNLLSQMEPYLANQSAVQSPGSERK